MFYFFNDHEVRSFWYSYSAVRPDCICVSVHTATAKFSGYIYSGDIPSFTVLYCSCHACTMYTYSYMCTCSHVHEQSVFTYVPCNIMYRDYTHCVYQYICTQVVVNQDKTSQQLRTRIQELELELQEFKSGRMVRIA